MAHWLLKSEPFKYSWDDFVKEGNTVWDGVRNYAARNNLREMRVGEECFYYHSNEGLAIVGIAEVIEEAFPDPTAREGDWSAVRLAPNRALSSPVTLSTIKGDSQLEGIELVRLSRLSVCRISTKEWKRVLQLAGRG